MGKISACIFDLDGVVVDTAKYHYIAWKSLANELGFDFTEEDNERLKGVSRMRSLDILLEIGGVELDEKTKLELADKKNKNYVEYILKMTPDEILPGVKDFFNELKAKGIKIALGSASKNAMTILNQLELTDYFDAVVDGTHVSNAKPDPEVFLKGAELLGVSPSECIVFEDAEAGVEAAINGNMKCVGIGSPDVLGKANIVVPGFVGFSMTQLNF
ncbi:MULTISPECIES: beta-phosphoglucomutase [unclassified Marinifilum]|jgi:beta-phosphoglucomutase|uniref:beta-phosphoglucomutase n=1 Tax=unclassified Marinifilum TaxID=2642519 RepID=UPI002273ED8E|nr:MULTISPECIES: beta-phosphoglucomutase [unclassified Marinifilum]MCY1633778.1 beta-phosphoglucomutase [Marinifilum sp. D737]MDQ2180015.1 beta-phosphoglucomutase [Marinifilum sp. D714]